MTLFSRSQFLKMTGLGIAILMMGCSPKTSAPDIAAEPSPDAVYYLVRHAEKTKEKDDPGLTEAGHKRAKALAARLADVPLTKIYSSDYIRTRDTAAPIAKAKGLDVVIYDPRQLEDFAASLLGESGHILVVGHSNTTPPLSAFMGGAAGTPIVEATEYNRLYVLRREGDTMTSVIETFGD